ncbi:sensor histidine kinase [Pseudonocardia xishanensis]|uniref:Histidine kinase/HSP90-like ATPase domain-containing protein n=1 Tax=Pseudonocardia xishanensis TaxID=630995 RepID=A0ABP8S2Y9_9PSEU
MAEHRLVPDTRELDSLLDSLLDEVVAELGATAAAVESPARVLASVGDPRDPVVRVPLPYGNETVGTLVVPAAGHRPHVLGAAAPRLAAAVRRRTVARSAETARLDETAVPGGLVAALPRIAGSAAVEVRPLPALAPDTEAAASLIAGEALANAARHAPGAPARVRVRVRGPYLEVQITDEGPGLPRGFTAGTGVPAMRGWAAAAGGTCTIRRSVSGTVVEAMLPMGPVIPRPR